jgi:hypothetical protein
MNEDEEYPTTVFDYMGIDPNDEWILRKDRGIDMFFLQDVCTVFSVYCAVFAAMGAILCLIL